MLLTKWFVFVLLFSTGHFACVKNKIKIWSPTNCYAGRRFFARLNLPGHQNVQQPYVYPWLVELEIVSLGQLKFCTGVLINDRYVLTTQNCVLPPVQPNDITVHLGCSKNYKLDVDEILQSRILQRRVMQIIRHYDYDPQDPKTAGNNMALLKIQPVKYSKTIYPIHLPEVVDKFLDFSKVTGEAIAWSYFQDYQKLDKKLKHDFVRILNSEQCQNFDANYNQIITPEMLCSVGAEINMCGEQNGGFLMIEKPGEVYSTTTLLGLFAWESPTITQCQPSGLPVAYIRIDRKLNWIKSNTQDADYCKN